MAPAEVPRHADIVVAGGGCMGASVAFHLARRGERVLLLERRHVSAGATGHSGAIVRQHYETRLGIRLARDSLAFFRRFEAETGAPAGFRTTGFFSGTRAGDRQAFDRLVDLLRSERVRAERLDPSEAETMEPQLDVSDYVALVHDPDAGYADPILTAVGFAMGAARDGAAVLESHEVRELLVRRGRVEGVRLRGGARVLADRVVVAAGNWTPELLRTPGVRLPVRFVKAHVAILRRPAAFGREPCIHFDFYHNTYSRPEGERDVLVGYMDTDPRKTIRDHELRDDSLPAATGRDLRARLAKRFPAMARAQPRGGWAGVYDVTPDTYPIVGQVGPEGLFVAVGFSGHGFKLSPEIGRLLAEDVASGRPSDVLRSLGAARFEQGTLVRPEAGFPVRRGPRLP